MVPPSNNTSNPGSRFLFLNSHSQGSRMGFQKDVKAQMLYLFKTVVYSSLYLRCWMKSLSEPFVLLGLPDRIEITKDQLPHELNHSPIAMREHHERVRETESKAYGMVVNSFEELEEDYLKEFKKLKEGKVWCIGPLSLSSLEASDRSFKWVIRSVERAQKVEKWLLGSRFEDGVKDRGLIIRDWAPQVLILLHPSDGGFSTHFGVENGLPERCESADALPGLHLFPNLSVAVDILQNQLRLLTWLDLKEPGSVVYACFGGSSRVIPSPTNQGLEASDRSLKWVIKSTGRAQEVEKWLLESRFEDRVKDR
ncbi:UDP-glucuronosyl/UDP-glucosyltransferase [Artemisia annua]|uniref:UDP-glucuronosyl/UDP-glucosyltransferase n=1 Tax=Artemisia annua TaxID=35608 RepID=A0A2U1P7J6_ARTAN|nr:UDP-glucuronosyl/UDP-glucosyltransferase [Artemisia annua]